MTTTPPKPKAQRRPEAEVSADLFQRAEATRLRGIKRTGEYKTLEAARLALTKCSTQRFAPPQVKALNDAEEILEAVIAEVLAPPKPAGPVLKQAVIP